MSASYSRAKAHKLRADQYAREGKRAPSYLKRAVEYGLLRFGGDEPPCTLWPRLGSAADTLGLCVPIGLRPAGEVSRGSREARGGGADPP